MTIQEFEQKELDDGIYIVVARITCGDDVFVLNEVVEVKNINMTWLHGLELYSDVEIITYINVNKLVDFLHKEGVI